MFLVFIFLAGIISVDGLGSDVNCNFTGSINDTDVDCLIREYDNDESNVMVEVCRGLEYPELYTGWTNATLWLKIESNQFDVYANNPSFVVLMKNSGNYSRVGYCELFSGKKCSLKLTNTNNEIIVFAKLSRDSEFCFDTIQPYDSDAPWCSNSTKFNCLYFDDDGIVRFRTFSIDTSTSQIVDLPINTKFIFFKHSISDTMDRKKTFLRGPEVFYNKTDGRLMVKNSIVTSKNDTVGNMPKYLSGLIVDRGDTWCFIVHKKVSFNSTSRCAYIKKEIEEINVSTTLVIIFVIVAITMICMIVLYFMRKAIKKCHVDKEEKLNAIRIDKGLQNQCKISEVPKEIIDEVKIQEEKPESIEGQKLLNQKSLESKSRIDSGIGEYEAELGSANFEDLFTQSNPAEEHKSLPSNEADSGYVAR